MISERHYTVLLIDDSPEDREIYRRYLKYDHHRTYKILEASSAAIGLEICQNSPPDVILLDYLLSSMDGLGFLESFRQQDGKLGAPVLMLTGNGNEIIAAQAIKKGAYDYLIKDSLTPELLCKTVAHAIEQFQLQQQILRQQQQQQIVAEISLRIRRSLNLQEILQTTVDEVRQFLQTDRVIIFRFSQNWHGVVVVESCGSDWTSILSTEIYDPCFSESYVEPFKQGLYTAKSDIYTAGIEECHLKLLSFFQVKANLVVPILKDEELWGLLIVHHCTAPRPWQDVEISLLQQIASQLGIALQQAELLNQLQTKLAEQQQAQAALKESQLQLQRQLAEIETIYQSAPIGLNVLDTDLRFVRINQQLAEMNGFPVEAHLGRTIGEVLPNMADLAEQLLRPILATGEPLLNIEITGETPAQPGVQRVWLESFLPIREGDRVIGINTVCEEITDRKRAEAALQQSEARLRLAQIASNSAVWDWEIQTHKLFWSPEYYQLYGLDPGIEPNYENWISCIHPDDREQANRQILQTLEQKSCDLRAEFRVLRSGEIRWFAGIGQVLYDAAEQPVRMIGITIDITQQKQAEIALQDLNLELEHRVTQRTTALQQQTRLERLRWRITQAIRQSLDLYAILNTATEQIRHTLQTDRAAVYRFHPGWNSDCMAESVSDRWVKLVDSGIEKVWEDTYLHETQSGRFQNHETLVISDIYGVGLQPCHIHLLEQFQIKAYAVVPIFRGEMLWGLLAIYQNRIARGWQDWEIELLEQIASQLSIALQQSELYNQLQIELQERQQTEAVLRETERRWQSLLNNVQLIVIGLDINGIVEYVNPCFLELTGYQLNEVLGKPWFDHFLNSGQKSTVKSVFLDVLEHNLHPHYQSPILTKAGEERMIAWSNTLLQDTSGVAIGTVSIGEDITERYKIDRMKAEFISVVSHELRTPLTSMQAALSLLNEKIIDPLSEEGEATIQIATEGTDRLVRLVNDILDLERMESGKVRLEKHPCNIDDLINIAVAQMQELANQVGITLETNPCHVQLNVDGDRLLQILTNLLSNAIKFSPNDSTVRLSVEQKSIDNAPFLQFTVCDQGRGIPADKLESIFDRFHQVDASDSRDKGGTGLGLAICRTIVQQYGGAIWAESTVGQGSTFYFTLPMEERKPSKPGTCSDSHSA